MTPNIPEAVGLIQILLTPVIMISACGLLLLTMQNRYGRLNDRLRELTRETMDLSQSQTDSALKHIAAIAQQIPDLLYRNKILRNALVLTFLSVFSFILVIFIIAFLLFKVPGFNPRLPLAVFLIGIFFLLLGIFSMIQEAYISHRAVTYETKKILKL